MLKGMMVERCPFAVCWLVRKTKLFAEWILFPRSVQNSLHLMGPGPGDAYRHPQAPTSALTACTQTLKCYPQ